MSHAQAENCGKENKGFDILTHGNVNNEVFLTYECGRASLLLILHDTFLCPSPWTGQLGGGLQISSQTWRLARLALHFEYTCIIIRRYVACCSHVCQRFHLYMFLVISPFQMSNMSPKSIMFLFRCCFVSLLLAATVSRVRPIIVSIADHLMFSPSMCTLVSGAWTG
jgi:hypothetical protein